MFKKIFKKISCVLCFGSKCSYNQKGEGKFKLDFDQDKINANINDKIDDYTEIENWSKEVPSNI